MNKIIGVTECLISLASHNCGFESRQVLMILTCDEAVQLAYGGSCNNK